MKCYIVKLWTGEVRYHLITPFGGTIADNLKQTQLMKSFGMDFLKSVSFKDYRNKYHINEWYSKAKRGRIVGVVHV